MLIRVQDLELRNIEFDEEFQPGSIDFGAELQQIGALKVSGHAELIVEHEGHERVEDIRLVGKLRGRVGASCARCLEPVQQDVVRSFDLLHRPLAREKGSDEVSISESETEIGYYSGEGLELEDALREQVLLALPLKLVCSDDCKGLCPQCGKNLNTGACQCVVKSVDVRWNGLRDLRDKLQ